ncbi:MAG: oligopeptide/dipeptide ABC transporter ATP-binding protein [Streptosporangiaceae bacterium]
MTADATAAASPAAGPEAPVLEVRQLSKHFAIRNSRKLVHACDDVSLELYAGQTLGLIGESGSGKTTVGRCVLRLIDPTSGSISLDSVDITKSGKKDLQRLRRRMQIVFQEPAESFNPVLTVGSQIELSLKVFSELSPAARKRRVDDLLDRVGVPAAAAGLLPGALPAGALQKCSIARALASEPRLLVLDEPTSALAPEAEADVLGLLTKLQQDFGLAYLFISHDLSLVRSFCDFVAVMYLGQIVELGPKADVYSTPRHPYTQALLAAVLRPDPRQRLAGSGRGPQLKGEIPSPIDLPTGCYLASRCKYVTGKCTAERQELIQIDTSTVVRCWRAGDLPVALPANERRP